MKKIFLLLFLIFSYIQLHSATVVHTTQTDFSSGTFAGWGTDVTSTGGGDIRLGLGGAENMGFSTHTSLCPNMPAARAKHAMVVWNGKMYVAGGRDSSDTAQSTVWYATINADGTVGSWTVTTPMPGERYEHVMTVWNGRLYVSGGYDAVASVQNTVWYANINADGTIGSWIATTSMPDAKVRHAMTSWNGRLYVISGSSEYVWYADINADGTVGNWSATANFGTLNEISAVAWNGRLYVTGGNESTVRYAAINADGTIGSWAATTSMPDVRTVSAMAVWNGRLYVTGGNNLTVSVSSSIFVGSINNTDGSIASWVTSPNPLPECRAKSRMVAWNGRLYASGGKPTNITSDSAAQSTVWYASINADGTVGASWNTETNSLPTAMTGHAMSVWNGRLYVTGGWDGVTRSSFTWYAPINADGTVGSWTETTLMPDVRVFHTMSVWNGVLYVAGGRNNTPAPNHLQSTVWYAPINANGSVGSWTATTGMPAARMYHAMSVWNGRLYVAGGWDNYNNPQSTVWYAAINADGTVGSWTATTVLPAVRYGLALASWNGRLYTTGGNDGAWRYAWGWQALINADGTVGSWSSTSEMPGGVYDGARDFHATVSWNDNLYVIGGHDTTIGGPGTNVWFAGIYAAGGLSSWGTLTSLPAGRKCHALASWNGRLYVTGGGDTTSGNNTVWSSRPPFYSSTGTYFSPVIDLGSIRNIDSLSWTQSASPANSSANFYIATSTISTNPISTYNSVTNGGAINTVARYVHYKSAITPGGTIGSPVRDQTPVIDDVTLTHSPDVAAPVLTSFINVNISSFSARFQDNSYGEDEFIFSTGTVSGPTNAVFPTATTSKTTTGTIYVSSLTALIANTTYYVRLRAHQTTEGDTFGNYSGELSTATLCSPPDNLQWSVVNITSATVIWGSGESPANPDNTIYITQLSTASNFTGTIFSSTTIRSNQSAVVIGLSPNTTYYSRVIARNWNNVDAITTVSASTLTLCNIPAGVSSSFTELMTNSITANWSANNNSSGTEYQVVKAQNLNFTSDVSTTNWITSTNFAFAPLTANTTYFFRVKARDYNQRETAWYLIGSTATLCSSPDNPQWSTINTSNVKVVWGLSESPANPSDMIYITQVAESPDFQTGTVYSSSTPRNNQSAVVSPLMPNTTRYARVIARNWNGVNAIAPVPASTSTLCNIPSSVSPAFTAITTNSITANWSQQINSASTKYLSQVATDSGFTTGLADSGWVEDTASWNRGSLTPNTTYFFRVKARNNNNIETLWCTIGSTSTLCEEIGIPAVTNVYISSITVNINTGNNPYPTLYAIKVASGTEDISITGKYVTAVDGTLGLTAVWLSTDSWSSTNNIWVGKNELVPNTTHHTVILAKNWNGVISVNYNSKASTPTLCNIPAEILPKFTDITASSITANWSANNNPSGTEYQVVKAQDSNFISDVSTSNWITPSNYTFSPLMPHTTYYFRVRARNYNQRETVWYAIGSTSTLNTFPVLSWTGEPGYESDGLEPPSGSTTTVFIYRVKYTDVDNDEPASGYPRVVISSGSVVVKTIQMNYVSGTYNTGAIYSTSTLLSSCSSYSYTFQARDNYDSTIIEISGTGPDNKTLIGGYVKDPANNGMQNVKLTISGDESSVRYTDANGYYEFLITTMSYTITPSSFSYYLFSPSSRNYLNTQTNLENQDFIRLSSAPVLSWTGESGYIADGIEPDISTYSAVIAYRIKYMDSDNDAPAAGYPRVIISSAGVAVKTIMMNYVSGNYLSGAIYSTATLLSPCSFYEYTFQTKDIFDVTAADVSEAGPGSQLSIKGYVFDPSGVPMSNVAMTLSGDDSAAAITNSSGYYQFINLTAGYNYTVSPSSFTYYSFNPSSRTYTIADNQTNQNFTRNNNFSTLTWSDEVHYGNTGVFPSTGSPNLDTFVFKIVYADADNDPPKNGYPKLHVLKNNAEIDNKPMTPISGYDYLTKITYSYETVFSTSGGDYTYYFEVCGIWDDKDTTVQKSFIVSSPPTSFENKSKAAIDGATVISGEVFLEWSASDSDDDFLTYNLYVSSPQVVTNSDAIKKSITFSASKDKVYSGAATSHTLRNLVPGKTYFWQIEATDLYGVSGKSPVFSFKTLDIPVDRTFNYPNPFNPKKQQTRIVYRVNTDQTVKIKMYSEYGDLIYQAEQDAVAGTNEFTYDGRDDQGNILYNGSYICRVEKAEGASKCYILVIK